jgi:hypothetical protein
MTTLHQPREAGSTGLFALRRGAAGATHHRPEIRRLRVAVVGDALAGDVSLVAGSRGKVIVLEAGRDGLSLRKMPAALAAIARADLVLLPSDEPGPVAALARRMTSPQRRASIRAPEGAHEAARHAYFAAIADALIGVDADGLFSYADRAELAAAGHASDAR